MDNKAEGTVAVIAALIVLFSAMWDARVSVAVALLALLGFGVYKLIRSRAR